MTAVNFERQSCYSDHDNKRKQHNDVARGRQILASCKNRQERGKACGKGRIGFAGFTSIWLRKRNRFFF